MRQRSRLNRTSLVGPALLVPTPPAARPTVVPTSTGVGIEPVPLFSAAGTVCGSTPMLQSGDEKPSIYTYPKWSEGIRTYIHTYMHAYIHVWRNVTKFLTLRHVYIGDILMSATMSRWWLLVALSIAVLPSYAYY